MVMRRQPGLSHVYLTNHGYLMALVTSCLSVTSPWRILHMDKMQGGIEYILFHLDKMAKMTPSSFAWKYIECLR